MQFQMFLKHLLVPIFFVSSCLLTAIPLSCGADIERDPILVESSQAAVVSEMKPYRELIEHTEAKLDMLPIPGGSFLMGSPDSEPDRKSDEGPQREISVDPFWMSKFEMTWDVYDVWAADLDLFIRRQTNAAPNKRDTLADVYQVSQPTKPYMDMSFGMGKRGYPCVCMTQHAARVFCKWLTAKTGRYYRLPTEAEWEYACRAGTETAYSFGDDASELEDYAWFADNCDEEKYAKVGKKKPNPFGLYDMHGNVAEWVLDQYDPTGYPGLSGATKLNPLAIPRTLYPRTVRGGGFNQDAKALRSASREGSTEDWIAQDPQEPVSIWYLTDALHVGFRVVRPLTEPTEEEKLSVWEASLPVMKERPVPLDRE